jgi:hypothetical protein
MDEDFNSEQSFKMACRLQYRNTTKGKFCRYTSALFFSSQWVPDPDRSRIKKNSNNSVCLFQVRTININPMRMKTVIQASSVFVIVLLNSLIGCSQEYTTRYFPPYTTVLHDFIATYDYKKDFEEGTLYFEKRKEGWFISVFENNPDKKLLKHALFWSAKEHKLVDPGFTKKKYYDDAAEIPAELKNDWTVNSFRISPYQGYVGWEKDVIAEFKDRADLSDSLTYALARAYSSRATNLLEQQGSFPDEKERFILPDHRDALNPQQLETFRDYQHKAIACFLKVKELNPSFETMVGNISIKCANEYLSSFLSLLSVQNETEALKEIPGTKLYDEFIISYAKNLLNTCAKNAILFTFGDNDTFPLLYVQAKFGFRTDVRLVNLSLLQLPRYIDLLKEPVFTSSALPVSLTRADYAGERRDYLLLKPGGQYMDLGKAFQMLNDTSCISKDKKVYYFPSADLKVAGPNREEIKFTLKQSYILKSELIFLDLLAHNQNRPMYFANTVDPAWYANYTKFLSNEGLAFQVIFREQTSGSSTSVERTKMYQNLMNTYEWKGLDTSSSTTKTFVGENYRMVFYTLIQDLIAGNQMDSAKVVFDKAIALFPDKVLSFDIVMVYYIEFALQLKNESLALELARKTIPHLTGIPQRSQCMAYLTEVAKRLDSKKMEDLLKQFPE